MKLMNLMLMVVSVSYFMNECWARFSLVSSGSFPHNIERPYIVMLSGGKLSTYISLKILDISDKVVLDIQFNKYSGIKTNDFISTIEMTQVNQLVQLKITFERRSNKHTLVLSDETFFKKTIDLLMLPKITMEASLKNDKHNQLEVKCISTEGVPPITPTFKNLKYFDVASMSTKINTNNRTTSVELKIKKNDWSYLYCVAGKITKMILVEGESSTVKISSNNIGVASPNEKILCSDKPKDTKVKRAITIEWKVRQGPRESNKSYQITNANGTFQFKDAPIGSVWQLSCTLFKNWYGKKRNVTKNINLVISPDHLYNKLGMLEKAVANSAASLDAQLKKLEEYSKGLLVEKMAELRKENNQLKKEIDEVKLRLNTSPFTHISQPLGYYLWVIPKFLTIKDIQKSPYFYYRGYRFRLIVNIRGYNSNSPKYLAIYFELCEGELDDSLPWPFPHKLTFIVLAGGYSDKRVLKTYSTKYEKAFIEAFERPKPCTTAFGDKNMMKISYVKDKSNKVLDDEGSLHIKFVID